MHFIEDIKKEDFEAFCKEKNSDFMQTYAWGQFQAKARDQIAHYVGLEKNGKLVCVALLLEKKGPFGYSYFYSPRGFVMDYKLYLDEFTAKLKQFLKKRKAIYLKVDPDLVYQTLDEKGNAIATIESTKEIYDHFLKLGYHHTGFNLYFDHNQPRFTFRISFDHSLEELEKKIHKSVWKKIKKTSQYHMTFRETKDIQTFHELIEQVGERDNFEAYSYDYYQNFYNYMSPDHAKVFELSVNPKLLFQERTEELNKLKQDLEEKKIKENDIQNVQNSCERLQKEIDLLEPYKEKEDVVVCSQICAYNQTRLWTLYIGNNDLGKNFYAVNRMYYEVIKYGKENGFQDLDLFGTVGDPNTDAYNYAGLHNFKKNFGGEYIELIGEFDLICKPFFYRILPTALKIIRKIKR